MRVTPAEVAALASHLGMTEAVVRSRFVAQSGDRLREGLSVACIFLDESRAGATCRIYPVRPERCRSWPFWPELAADPAALEEAMRFCPGIEPLRDPS